MTYGHSNNYETVAEIGGVKYEVVCIGVDMWGNQMYQACTFQEVMRPTMERTVLGTYSTRADALAKLESLGVTNGELASTEKK